MGVLMVRCQRTGREFATGINITEESFSILPDTLVKSRCPHCGQVHAWWIHDARLADSIPPSQWVEARDHAP
jgi:predicted RNA-binding Zn-ribbon protein involved in translation (DUF1610 family)